MAKDPFKNGSHKIELLAVTPEMKVQKISGFRLKDLDQIFPWTKDPTMQCDCGVEVPVPHGSLSNYAKHLAKELGSEDVYVVWRVWHLFESPQPSEVLKEIEEKAKHNRHNTVIYKKPK